MFKDSIFQAFDFEGRDIQPNLLLPIKDLLWHNIPHTRLLRVVQSQADCIALQNDLVGNMAVKWQKKLNVNKHRIPHLRKITQTINPRWWLITYCHSQKTFWSSWAGLSKNANILLSNSQKPLSTASARKHWSAKQKIIQHLCSKSKGEINWY